MKDEGAATSRKPATFVIPAKAGIQVFSYGYSESFSCGRQDFELVASSSTRIKE